MCSQHGGPLEECGDPERDWFPQRTVCYAAMETAAANWRYDRLHEKAPFHNGDFSLWSTERSNTHPYHHRDGVTLWVAKTDLSPDGTFLSSPKAEG